jgi:antitoxin (DNA-binding transcriptional repressor) of toxin-antitoxin stability system
MSQQISQRELRNDSGRIMRALDEGKSFVVASHGRAVGELRPLRRQRFIPAQAAVEMFRHAPALDRDAVLADLDAHVDQGIEPRA